MDPTRLIHEQGDGFERDLLDAARRDEPPSGAVARSAAVLGLAVTSVSITATTAGTASAASAKAGTAVFGTAALAKWIGIGAAVGVVATSGVRIITDPSIVTGVVAHDRPAKSTPAKRVDEPPAAKAPAPPAIEPTGEPAAAQGPEPVAPLPAGAPNASTKSRSAAAPIEPLDVPPPPAEPAPPSLAPSLAAELAALERGRRALLLHRPADALRALDDYSSAKKTSVFEAEAQLLRIEALLQAGQRDQAVRLAEQALEQSPNGSHAARLREIAGTK